MNAVDHESLSAGTRVWRSRCRSLSGSITGLLLMSMTVFVSAGQVRAQAPGTTPAVSQVSAGTNNADDKRYRIGAGDVLTILVRKAPELSLEAVRVDQNGMIRIPMIDGEVLAACSTENELATKIATLYLEYKRNPSVTVFVRDYQSRPVSVIGAVNVPGQFRLQRQVRLLELLSLAGGPSEKAGRIIDLIHTGGAILCENNNQVANQEGTVQGLGIYQLNDTLTGKEGSNPFVSPGDIVSLPEADQIFVVGHVMAPRAIALKDKQITISRAIAMAGGVQRDGNSGKVRIVRQVGESAKQQILVDLGAISKQKAEDIVLLPNDIVEVPSSTGKTILSMLTMAVPSAIANSTVRVIP